VGGERNDSCPRIGFFCRLLYRTVIDFVDPIAVRDAQRDDICRRDLLRRHRADLACPTWKKKLAEPLQEGVSVSMRCHLKVSVDDRGSVVH
jgi:hypothetical protein